MTTSDKIDLMMRLTLRHVDSRFKLMDIYEDNKPTAEMEILLGQCLAASEEVISLGLTLIEDPDKLEVQFQRAMAITPSLRSVVHQDSDRRVAQIDNLMKDRSDIIHAILESFKG